MHRIPATVALVAVALSTAAGCVSVSEPVRGRPPLPRITPGPAREALIDTGPDDAAEGPSSDSAGEPSPHSAETRAPASGRDDAPGPPHADDARAARGGDDTGPGESATPPARTPDRPSVEPYRLAPAPFRLRVPAPPAAPPPVGREVEEPHRAPEREAQPPRRPAPAPRMGPGAGVCGLGEQYGRWQQGSDASRICHQVYGR
ncbi:hypothetical protein AB0K09_06770 [Streptomyces sp. NPDC049577]|uniref:hypothetical protein n=1 Tax=Streptomyces sp. NPDC049577 TaxID=3155153 RepID=UPI00342F7AEE